MAQQTVEVEIDVNGKVVIQTAGFQGASCLQATKTLEAVLGTVTEDAKTREFHQAAGQSQSQQAKAGQ
jgi:hypothetical protein